MSLLSRDELRIVLHPEHVVLVRARRELTRRGLACLVREREVLPASASVEDEPSWSGAVRTLTSALAREAGRKASATVILSNRFVHYALVPWSGSLDDETEEAAYARHCFKNVYGDLAEAWDLRVSHDQSGVARLGCGVDPGLPEAVRGACAAAGVTLKSIQPHLMAAFNLCRVRLHRRTAWFVVFEQGSLCLGYLEQGRWAAVRSLRAGPAWRHELPWLLEREACLVECATPTDEVYLWAPELGEDQLPARGRWNMVNLKPRTGAGYVPEQDGRFALAMGVAQ